MNRREFLRCAGMTAAGFFLPELTCWAAGSEQATTTDNRLIVIFLRGAVDGLNVLVPYSDQKYYSVRPNIAIGKPGTESGALELNGDFGLHPVLAPLLPLWKNKTMAFVTCCGSPEATRSHFDAQDYMESGMPGCKTAPNGWLSRLLQELPDSKYPMRAINIGATTPRILQGSTGVATYTPQLAGKKMPLDRPVIAAAFQRMYEGRADDLGKAFSDGIKARVTLNSELDDEMLAANQGAPAAKNFRSFGQQLGRLFAKDPKIRVAFVALGGFDTHVSQGAAKGPLANQLTTLGNGIAQLVEGMGDAYARTTILVMSEFGRTVKENGNLGTDHGHGNMLWVLGGNVAGGRIYGKWPGLEPKALFEGRDLPVITDFRTVVASVIQEQMRLSAPSMKTIFPDFSLTDKQISGIIKG